MSRKSSLLMSPLFGSSSAKSSSTPQSSSYFRQPNMVRNCSSRINRTSSLINQSSWHLNFQTKAISLRIRCQFGSFSSSANSSSPMVSMVSSSPSPFFRQPVILKEKPLTSSQFLFLSNHKSLQTHAFQCPQANYHSYARVIICRSRR
eukprot:UN0452